MHPQPSTRAACRALCSWGFERAPVAPRCNLPTPNTTIQAARLSFCVRGVRGMSVTKLNRAVIGTDAMDSKASTISQAKKASPFMQRSQKWSLDGCSTLRCDGC